MRTASYAAMLSCVPNVSELSPPIADLVKRGCGVVDVRSAKNSGFSTRRIQRLASEGRLVRLARGCYADREEFDSADPWRRYELRSRAFVLACGDFTFAAEWSAAMLWSLPTIGDPPELPVVVQRKAPGRGSSRTRTGRIRVVDMPSEHWLVSGHPHGPQYPAMSPAWTVVDLARTAPVHHTLVAADAALRVGEPLDEAAALFTNWNGADRMRWVLRFADGRSESPLETLGRFACIQYDLPMPVSNAWVGDVRPEKRVDGLWPWHWVAFEGDGALKYNDRPDAAHIVAAEKEREWALRQLGLTIVRYGWDLAYFNRRELAARFSAMLGRPRSTPIRWWKHDPQLGPVTPRPEDYPSPYPLSITLPVQWQRNLNDQSAPR